MGDISRIAAEILLSLQPVLAGANVEPPRMLALEPQALQMRVCGKPCKVMAWYSEGTIYIDNRLDVVNHMGDRSIVVHELVHHVQRMNIGARAQNCEDWLRREQEAYSAQAQWLHSKGLRARKITLQARFLRCGTQQQAKVKKQNPSDANLEDTILSTHSDATE
jgi:hypothetical protein